MANGKTILFAPASNVLFHVGRCLGLSRELKRRGHRIIFVGTRRYLQDPAIHDDGGYDFYELPDFDTDEAMDILRTLRKAPSRRLIQEMVEAELKALKQLAPDLIVADFRLTMYISARVLGIPIVSLLLSLWMQPYMAMRPTVIRTFPQAVVLKKLIGETATALLTPLFLRLIVGHKMRPFRDVAQQYGQTPRAMLWDLLVGDYNLLLDTEAWSPTKPLPDNFQRVGPILWEPCLPPPDWLEQLDRAQPVVFINFGSTAHKDLFRKIFSDFGDTPYHVIVATGGQIDPQEFKLSPNIHVEKFLPVGTIMRQADLVIYHGGAGTAYQVMKAGVPSIVIATHMDQEYQGIATEAHQVGLFFTMHEVLARPGLILSATERMMRDLAMYRRNIKKFQDDLLGYDAPVAAADCLERFMRAERH